VHHASWRSEQYISYYYASEDKNAHTCIFFLVHTLNTTMAASSSILDGITSAMCCDDNHDDACKLFGTHCKLFDNVHQACICVLYGLLHRPSREEIAQLLSSRCCTGGLARSIVYTEEYADDNDDPLSELNNAMDKKCKSCRHRKSRKHCTNTCCPWNSFRKKDCLQTMLRLMYKFGYARCIAPETIQSLFLLLY